MLALWTRLNHIFVALIIRAGVMGIQFLVSFLIALAAGPLGAGIYGIYNAWLAIFTGVAGMGSYTHAMRTVSVLSARSEGRSIRIYLESLVWLVLKVCLVVSLGLLLFSDPLAERFLGNEQLQYVIIAAAIGGVFTIVLKIGAESLKGLGLVNKALALEWGLLPSAMVLTLTVFILAYDAVDMRLLLLLRTLYICAVTLLLYISLSRAIRNLVNTKQSETRTTVRTLTPFWGSEITIVWFMNIPLLVLPYFVSTEEIGIFSIAQKLILTVTSALVVLSSIFGPKLARAYDAGDRSKLKRLLLQTQVISGLIYLPIFVLFLFAPVWVLGWFGADFEKGANLLIFMACGQLISALCGLGDYALHMMHRERWFLIINIFSSVLMAVSCITLTHLQGVEGAAVAVAVSLAIKQALGYLAALYALSKPLKH